MLEESSLTTRHPWAHRRVSFAQHYWLRNKPRQEGAAEEKRDTSVAADRRLKTLTEGNLSLPVREKAPCCGKFVEQRKTSKQNRRREKLEKQLISWYVGVPDSSRPTSGSSIRGRHRSINRSILSGKSSAQAIRDEQRSRNSFENQS